MEADPWRRSHDGEDADADSQSGRGRAGAADPGIVEPWRRSRMVEAGMAEAAMAEAGQRRQSRGVYHPCTSSYIEIFPVLVPT